MIGYMLAVLMQSVPWCNIWLREGFGEGWRWDPGLCAQVEMYPSKSDGMFVPESLIFRSDSNGEDLEGYAGAGCTTPSPWTPLSCARSTTPRTGAQSALPPCRAVLSTCAAGALAVPRACSPRAPQGVKRVSLSVTGLACDAGVRLGAWQL